MTERNGKWHLLVPITIVVLHQKHFFSHYKVQLHVKDTCRKKRHQEKGLDLRWPVGIATLQFAALYGEFDAELILEACIQQKKVLRDNDTLNIGKK